ncbi:MAG TPA: adenylate/guanylate cyclase domain-containing protein [Gallionella sp.]|nr:adenylate/guanylate cyclase domain-containing protein [Gallionella sp.]
MPSSSPNPSFGRIQLIALAVVALVAINSAWLNLFGTLDNRLSDFFVRQTAQSLSPDPDIVIVDIDEASLAAMQDTAGSWPWPRAVHAELLQGISRQRPRAIVFDLLFSEPDRYRPESDQFLNEVLHDLHNVYFPMAQLEGKQSLGVPLAELAKTITIPHAADADPDARAILLPPQAIATGSWRVGLINLTEDADGIARRYEMRRNVSGWQLESLPAHVMSDLGYPIPPQPYINLHWRGDSNAFKHISYSELYTDQSLQKRQRDPHELTGKIVVIGTTATGLHDIHATPISSMYPGVAILATALDNLKNQRFLHAAPPYISPLIAVMLIMLQFPLFVQRRIDVFRIGAMLLLFSIALLALQYMAMTRLSTVAMLTPLLFAWGFYFAAALSEYLREKKSREQTVRIFNRFLDPRVVGSLIAQGETPQSLSGQAREITVLFSDIRGFTTLSERRSPEEIVSLLNRYFSLQVEIIFRHGGTLDKFIGDAIMAFWGAPQDDPLHAQHAVAAALEMEQSLLRFKEELGGDGKDFDVGIGIHTGKAVVGFLGSETRMDYTAIGDTVNLSNRIEGLTKGVARILVSSETAKRCITGEGRNAFDFSAAGSYKVKGRLQEVELFTPVPSSP